MTVFDEKCSGELAQRRVSKQIEIQIVSQVLQNCANLLFLSLLLFSEKKKTIQLAI